MTDTQLVRRSRLLWAGGGLIAASALIAMSGSAMVAVALAVGARRWVARPDLPSRQFAKRHWDLARTAVAAGSQAWRSERTTDGGAPTAHSIPVAAGNFAGAASR